MRKHRLVLAAVMALAACDGGSIFGATRVPVSAGGTGSISGQVQADGGGLAGVTVLLANTDSTRTDATGTFAFRDLTPAAYTLTVRVPLGYAPAAGETNQRTVIIPAGGGSQQATFILQRTTTGGTF